MKVERVRLTNWMRFAGEHAVDLSGDVFGITAAHDNDPARSNWGGKTSFIEAVRFALYGAHRHAKEDDWITDGEPGGGVAVHLSSGMTIERTRRRGQATKLRVEHGGAFAVGDAAQELIDAAVGLTLADFDVTCWFGQKQLSRLILAKPGERFDLISSWFQLAPLQRCEDRTRMILLTIASQIQSLEVARSAAALVRTRLVAGLAVQPDESPAEALARKKAAVEALIQERREQVRAATTAAAEWEELKRAAAENLRESELAKLKGVARTVGGLPPAWA